MLTVREMEIIMVEVGLGKEPTIHGEEADKFREGLIKDFEFAKKMGWTIEIPFDQRGED